MEKVYLALVSVKLAMELLCGKQFQENRMKFLGTSIQKEPSFTGVFRTPNIGSTFADIAAFSYKLLRKDAETWHHSKASIMKFLSYIW